MYGSAQLLDVFTARLARAIIKNASALARAAQQAFVTVGRLFIGVERSD